MMRLGRRRGTATGPTESGRTVATRRGGVLPWRGVWRQARVDAAPLVVGLVVIAVASFLSAAVPQATAAVKTAEVRAAVSAPDARVDVVVAVPFSETGGERYEVSPGTADSSAWARGIVDDNMPATLRSVLAPSVTAIVGPELKAGVIARATGQGSVHLRGVRRGPRDRVGLGEGAGKDWQARRPVPGAEWSAARRGGGVRADREGHGGPRRGHHPR